MFWIMGSAGSMLDESLDYARVHDWSQSQVCYWLKTTQFDHQSSSPSTSSSASSSSSSSDNSLTGDEFSSKSGKHHNKKLTYPLTTRIVNKYEINGSKLLALNEHGLTRIGITKPSDQKLVLQRIDELKSFVKKYNAQQQQQQMIDYRHSTSSTPIC